MKTNHKENKRKHNKISLCMIVRNEEKNLARCLLSCIDLIDEIIIVDTGSKDQTKKIARQFGGQVFDYRWEEDFAAARNFGLQQASGDWILVLDADEFLEAATAPRIKDLTTRADAADVYLVPVKNLMIPELGEWQTFMVLRLFKNSPDLRYQGKIHEQVHIPAGKKVEFAENGPVIIHLGYTGGQRVKKNQRNLKMLNKALELEPYNPYYHYYLSTEYIIGGDLPRALHHVRQALAGIAPDVVLFRVAAVRNAVLCLLQLREYDEAEALLKSEIKTFSEFPDYYFSLGEVYREKGDLVKAVENFDRALEIRKPSLIGCGIPGSNGYKTLFYHGLCLEQMRRYFEAVESYRAALADNPAFTIPLANLVRCLLIIGGEKECMYYLSNRFTIVSPQLKLLVARLLFAGGYPFAAEIYTGEIDDEGTNYGKTMLLGEIALARGNVKEALAQFSRIPSTNKFYPTSLLFMCLCQWKLGTPVGKELITELASIKSGSSVVKLIKAVNSLFTRQPCGPLIFENSGETEGFIKYGWELFVKFVELKMYYEANVVGSYLIVLNPRLRSELAYCYRKYGAFDHANRLMGLSGSGSSGKGGQIAGPRSYLDLADSFLKMSAEFMDNVPVLPENPK
ncbi:glycosyltransferase [Thermincola potens]|uniref:Glycosyl transferase family 2 n=1 Tax=Thermincola potens (strain JR) TaxID=635013 RepID=D5XDV1_THEPJ|nr:TPR domain-containing glycosyltransferase [Thermincola potens]ADG81822.1 glycosyl transferase family 2 [Thermincola potens JR]